jgi:hypothetical protein
MSFSIHQTQFQYQFSYLQIIMAPKYDSIASLNVSKENWNVMVMFVLKKKQFK